MNDDPIVAHDSDAASVAVEQPPLVKQGWLRALLFVVAIVPTVLIWAAASVVILHLSGIDLHEGQEASLLHPVGIAIQAVYLLTALGLIWAFRRFVDRRSFVSLGFSLKAPFGRHLLYGLIWGVSLMAAVFGLTYALGGITVASTQFPIGQLVILVFTLLPAAVLEEVLLRGYLLHNLMQSTNRYVAVLFISLLFALGHSFNANLSITGLANIVLAGILLGVYYVHRQNLWFPMALHFAWNYMQSPVLGSPVSGAVTPSVLTLNVTGSDLLTGGKFGFEGSLVTTVLTIVAILAVHFTYRIKEERPAAS